MCWFAYGCGIQSVHTVFCKCAVKPVVVSLLRLSRRITQNGGSGSGSTYKQETTTDIWLSKLYIHQVNWRVESNSKHPPVRNKTPQKEKHGCLTRMRHESCGLQLQLSAQYKDALTYMIYMIYMIYISMSLQHLSYFYCHAALKWQKHKWNQIYIRSD